MKQMTLAICLILVCSLMSLAQPKQDTLSNATVIKLHKAGLGATVINSKMQSAICLFDLSTDALIILKKEGIPDDVVSAMLTKQSSLSGTERDTTSLLPGIYYCKGTPCRYTELEPSVYSQSKSGSGLLTRLSYGIAKTNMKSVLDGQEARLQISEPYPVFYFYFNKESTNGFGQNDAQSIWFSSATSPNEFLLVKFTVTKKNREVTTGSWNEYSGLSSGIDDRNKIPFKYEKISKGVYKVFSEKPLKRGEYCFMYAGGAAVSYGAPLHKVYDFGTQ